MKLTEQQIRDKVIELLAMCNAARMNLWLFSGIAAGVVDGELAGRVMIEELRRQPHAVQHYWLGACNCHGQLN